MISTIEDELVRPEESILGSALNAALRLEGGATILNRELPVFTSTFANEIVTCRLGDGTVRRILCKYGQEQRAASFGHRGGVPYEADIYCNVLEDLPLHVPRYYGHHQSADSATWLFIGFVHGADRVAEGPEGCVVNAAEWIGNFHRITERHPGVKVVYKYDSAYYRGWADRTLLFSEPVAHHYPWLATACDYFKQELAQFSNQRSSIIHGEYYPKNILYRAGCIFPVDWETAALAPGEIDIASLCEGWDPATEQSCKSAYLGARWPEGQPSNFEWMYRFAKLYINLRWLGDRREWTVDPESAWHFEQIHSLGKELGVGQ